MANGNKNCTITLKNVPCDLKTYYLQCGHDNDRCLSKEIINVLKRVKERREQDGDKISITIPNEQLMDKPLK